MKSLDIRRSFFDFFGQRDHHQVQSSTLYPQSDPTLLFTNAGMVPFKQYWLEGESVPFFRAVSIQKCLRAGGKKSDLENVGRTLRHHTFFEMLGNFSFGDYFKREAIIYSWDYFRQLGLPEDLLWVSIFRDDDEAYDIWVKDVGFPSDRIVRLGRKDNFWGPVGDQGVCGPCSEIYIDLPALKYGKNRAKNFDEEGETFLELWNLVFVQFYEHSSGQQDVLAKTGIDTGMGLERLSFVLQDVPNNYMTDLFVPMIEVLRSQYSVCYDPTLDMSQYHIILDHVRALAMALSEDINFSNEGRGYILKRILRRACLACYQLDIDFNCLADLSLVVSQEYGEIYPELLEASSSVQTRLLAETDSFDRLIQSVDRYIEPSLEKACQKGVWEGSDLFLLYDTYGVPYDLMFEYAERKGVSLDEKGFQEALEAQRLRARSSQSKDNWKTDLFSYALSVSQREGSQTFYGYECLQKEATVWGIWTHSDHSQNQITDQDDCAKSFWIILSNSVFYGESGGQIGDQGFLLKEGFRCASVWDAKKTNEGLILLQVSLLSGSLCVGDSVFQVVDGERRSQLKQSHTATHLLHSVLRDFYGHQVRQMGSLVDCARLRFDFSCSKESFSDEDIFKIESRVNQLIADDIDLEVQDQSFDEAKSQGVISFFDEKYADVVRCVRFGDVSSELCSGTHVSSTGLVGSFYILKLFSIGKGVRRVEAVVGQQAYRWSRRYVDQVQTLSRQLGVEVEQLEKKVTSLIDDNKINQQKIIEYESHKRQSYVDDLLKNVEDIGGIPCLIAFVEGGGIPDLQKITDFIAEKQKSVCAFLVGSKVDRFVSVIFVSPDLIQEGFKANVLWKDIFGSLGGRGGGKLHLAQGKILQSVDMDQLRLRICKFLEERKSV